VGKREQIGILTCLRDCELPRREGKASKGGWRWKVGLKNHRDTVGSFLPVNVKPIPRAPIVRPETWEGWMSDQTFEQQPFGDATFAENPENRCPVVLVLDTSGSMSGNRINELNAGLQTFRDELFDSCRLNDFRS
jgi:hypothetical protein